MSRLYRSKREKTSTSSISDKQEFSFLKRNFPLSSYAQFSFPHISWKPFARLKVAYVHVSAHTYAIAFIIIIIIVSIHGRPLMNIGLPKRASPQTVFSLPQYPTSSRHTLYMSNWRAPHSTLALACFIIIVWLNWSTKTVCVCRKNVE